MTDAPQQPKADPAQEKAADINGLQFFTAALLDGLLTSGYTTCLINSLRVLKEQPLPAKIAVATLLSSMDAQAVAAFSANLTGTAEFYRMLDEAIVKDLARRARSGAEKPLIVAPEQGIVIPHPGGDA